MDLRFLNKQLELVGIIDTAKSIQWLERYYEKGTFEVYVPVTDDVLEIVNQSYFIARDDSTYIGVIKHIENTDDVDEGNFLIIQGVMAEDLLSRRIVRNITYYEANSLFDICNNLLQLNVLNPVLQVGETTSPRKINCINTSVINNLSSNPTVKTQASYENNLLTFISELLKVYGSSIRLELNENGTFDVVLYSGIDRSYAQDINAFVVFSKEFDNLISSNYVFDNQKETNVLYVGGEDNETATEGRYIDKYELRVGTGVVSDIDRIEAYINATDLKQVWKDENEVEHTLTTDEYRSLLRARGRENVVEPSEELTATIDLGMYVYNQDFFLGDIVTIYNETLGAYVNKRIIGMDIVDDENGRTFFPTFEETIEETEGVENALLTENNEVMLTETGEPIVAETPMMYSTRATTSTASNTGVRISELVPVETDGFTEGCCMAIVAKGETRKITYGTLKERLSNEISVEVEALTTQEMDALLV